MEMHDIEQTNQVPKEQKETKKRKKNGNIGRNSIHESCSMLS